MRKFPKLTSLTRKIKRVYHRLMNPRFKKLLPFLLLAVLILPILIAIVISQKPSPKQEKLACPLANNNLCSKATKQNMGLGWKLATGSSILAAFDGTLKAQDTFGGKNPPKVYMLTNQTNTYQAGYIFIDEQAPLIKEKKVKKGDEIAKLPGITLDEMGYRNFNIIFYIVDIKKKERIGNLTPQSFGNLVLP